MTARLAVMGNPIEHSLSPAIHSAFGDLAGIDLSYERILVSEGEFESIATGYLHCALIRVPKF